MNTTFKLRGQTLDKHTKAIALSHMEAREYKPLPNTVLISYGNYNHGKIATPLPDDIKQQYKAVLEMPVNDIGITNKTTLGLFDKLFSNRNYHAFDKKDAKEVKDFIEKYKDSRFVVNCDAGVSRSSATALYINSLYAPEDYRKLRDLKIYFPNTRIFSYLKEGDFDESLDNKYGKELHR